MMRSCFVLSGAALTAALVSSASGSIVYSNNPPNGDSFTNATGTNTNPATPGAAIGASGWYYNNVRNSGFVGIQNLLPRSGNGSARLTGTQANPVSSKADIEYFHTISGNLAPMGTLGSINSLSYDWYRIGGASNAAAHLHPVLRLYVDGDGDLGTTSDRGYLVYERGYNPNTAAVPTDTWVSDDLFNFYGPGQSANLWQVAFGVGNFDTAGNWVPLQTWTQPGGFTPAPNGKTFGPGSAVYGLSLGIGSGWDTFDGAVDNVHIGFTGAPVYDFNFEVVPTPGSAALLGLGGLVAMRRRRA